MILLDTNVISEVMRIRPDPAVEAWLDAQPPDELWTASVVIAELISGIDLMPAGRRQRELREAVEAMIREDFQDQILSFDLDAARCYGQILCARQRMGRPMREMDAQIAAIARVHGAALATRDTGDFAFCDLKVVNPWASAGESR